MGFIFGALGAAVSFVAVIMLIAASRVLGFQSSTFNRIVLVLCPLVGMVCGWLLYSSIESKRIKSELEQDRIISEREKEWGK